MSDASVTALISIDTTNNSSEVLLSPGDAEDAAREDRVLDPLPVDDQHAQRRAAVAEEAAVDGRVNQRFLLESGDEVLVSGFGKFCVKEKAPRRGRNPATGFSKVIQ